MIGLYWKEIFLKLSLLVICIRVFWVLWLVFGLLLMKNIG